MSFAACKAVSHQWNVNKLSLYTVECFVHADYVLHFDIAVYSTFILMHIILSCIPVNNL